LLEIQDGLLGSRRAHAIDARHSDLSRGASVTTSTSIPSYFRLMAAAARRPTASRAE
jgi:hypothetical protein